MVRRILNISIGLMICMALCSVQALAADSVELSSENMTVQNRLPNVEIYCETTEEYETDATVEIDGYPAKVESVQPFRDTGAAVSYYALVDVSTSIDQKDMAAIRKALNGFVSEEMSSGDTIRLIPFGEKVYDENYPQHFEAGSPDFAKATKSLRADNDWTNLYDAIDTVAGILDSEKGETVRRSAVLVFTDGIDETTGGYKNEEEAPQALKKQGVPLYAFTVGNSKKGKDKLGVLARSLNGRIYTEGPAAGLSRLKESIDNTLTIDAQANNAADLGADFDVTVDVSGRDKALVRKGIAANKTGEEKNSIGYTIKKIVRSFWWLIAVVAIALIALIVLMRIRRHKGIIKVDGETVFRDNVTQKQHISVDRKNVMKLMMTMSVDGSNEVTRPVDLSGSIIVGRSRACDLYFDDPAMARQNFCIEMKEGRLYIRDLDSTNGTVLNGIRLTAPQELHRGDVIIAGKSRMIVNW